MEFSAHSWTERWDWGRVCDEWWEKGNNSGSAVEEKEVVGVRSMRASEGWLGFVSVSIWRGCWRAGMGVDGGGDEARVGALDREYLCTSTVDSSVTLLALAVSRIPGASGSRFGFSKFASGFLPVPTTTDPSGSGCRFRRFGSDVPSSAAVVTVAAFSLSSVPSWLTKSSKVWTFPLASFCSLRFSSRTRARSRSSRRTFRRRSTASGLASSRVEASGGRSPDGVGGVISSPRLCRAMAIFRLELSTHFRTWGFS